MCAKWAPTPHGDDVEARLTAMEAKLADWQAWQHHRYIGRDGKPVLARDLETRAEIAEAEVAALRAEVARLREAISAATDADFIWAAMDSINDMDVSVGNFADAVSRAQRAALEAKP